MSANQQYTVNTSGLNFRSQPLVHEKTLVAMLPQGALVTLIEKMPDGKWWRVAAAVKGKQIEGFVSQKYLVPVVDNQQHSIQVEDAVGGREAETEAVVRRVMPNLKAAKRAAYVPHLQAAMDEFNITSPLRVAAFLAQLAHESGEFRYMEEIASGAAYEGRRDLGNTQPGDGKRFKGRGPIQITGRYNYEKYGKLLGIDLIRNPHLGATPEVGFRTAGLYWRENKLNEYSDKEWFKTITKLINGGFNHYADRVRYYNRARSIFGIQARSNYRGLPGTLSDNEDFDSAAADDPLSINPDDNSLAVLFTRGTEDATFAPQNQSEQ